MKFTTILALLAATTSVVAVDYSAIPNCALTCIVSAISKAGCSTTDFQCQCVTKTNEITTNASPCIAGACSKDDQAKVQPAVAGICAAALSSSVSLPTASSSAASGSAKSATVTSSPTGSASKSASAAAATSTGAAADVRGYGAAVLGFAAFAMAI
ncbi:hypothetical protein BU16DRAFT_556888 [Lophium mytilinum]|uniref:CFEM domain-containing protein n=1 Tax=Lophium mytilinum TaxID=390894 RepID=A0A6A6R760_9PEZI|nr:hypothetical protein BU16DRAFT_556888 [Lophium mytilinum]